MLFLFGLRVLRGAFCRRPAGGHRHALEHHPRRDLVVLPTQARSGRALTPSRSAILTTPSSAIAPSWASRSTGSRFDLERRVQLRAGRKPARPTRSVLADSAPARSTLPRAACLTAISCILASSRARIKSDGQSRLDHARTDAIFIRRRSSCLANARSRELKSERLQSRLIGNFEWSYYQRRFDGVRFDLDRTDAGTSTARCSCRRKAASRNRPTCRCRRCKSAACRPRTRPPTAEWQAVRIRLSRSTRSTAAVVDNSGLDAIGLSTSRWRPPAHRTRA